MQTIRYAKTSCRLQAVPVEPHVLCGIQHPLRPTTFKYRYRRPSKAGQYASIGSEGYARKVQTANFCMNIIYARCQNATSLQSMDSARQATNACTYTSPHIKEDQNAEVTQRDFVGRVRLEHLFVRLVGLSYANNHIHRSCVSEQTYSQSAMSIISSRLLSFGIRLLFRTVSSCSPYF